MIKDSNNDSSSLIAIIDDYIKTIETISNQLKDKGEITLNEYNSYTAIKRKSTELKDESTKAKDNQEAFNYDIQLNKLRLLIEKIQSEIQNKKEYEFISNYFISENNPLDSSLSTNDSHKNNNNTDTLSNNSQYPVITHQSLSMLNSIELDSLNSLGDVLKLTSSSFLIEKAKFSNEVISKIKAIDEDINTNHNYINDAKQSNVILKKKSEKKLLPEINKSKAATNHRPNQSQNPNEKIDKEIEEEINNTIFKYTKNMKENAKAFNYKLKQDNKTLSSIEDIQNFDKDKTDAEQKRLNEFNYTLSIGFFRLVSMFIVAIVVFVFTLLIMRIFPKFA